MNKLGGYSKCFTDNLTYALDSQLQVNSIYKIESVKKVFGIYMYQIQAGNFVDVKKMMLIK